MVTSYTDIHILNVGRGSCTVIESPSGRTTMIDINDGGKLRPDEYEAIDARFSVQVLAETLIKQQEQKLVDPIDWYTENVGAEMWRFILSHPDKDHMAGIRRLLSGSAGIDITNFWDYDHERVRTEDDYGNNKAAWHDWLYYYAFHVQAPIDGITWPKRISPLRWATGNYWTDDSIQIFSPTTPLVEDCDAKDEYNDTSYVLKVSHGPTSHLLAPGDVESNAWDDMIEAGVDLRANVLIASHHGRNSGYHEEAMELISPEVVIISSDKIPAKDDAIKKYEARAKVFSTREHGALTVRMHTGGDIDVFDASGTRLAHYYDRPLARNAG
jgi:competence protein ComEC